MKAKRIIFLFCCQVFFVFWSSTSSYGQYYFAFKDELAQIHGNADWRFGPFRFSPRLQFRDIGYDGNVYYERQEDHPVSDYTGTISPQVNSYLLYRDWLILSLTENPEYVYYLKEKRERSFNNTFSPGIRLFLFQRIAIGGRYLFQRARIRASSEFDVRANQEIKEYLGNIYYETPRGTAIGFSGSLRHLSYEDIAGRGQELYLSRVLNREEREGSIELNYRIYPESLFFLKFGYTEYAFQHVESKWRDSYSYQALTGLRFPFSGPLRGVVSAGYKMLVPRRTWFTGFQGFIGNLSLDYRVSRFVFRLRGVIDTTFSYELNNIFFRETGGQAGISFYLTKFLRLDYHFERRELNYPRQIPVRYPDGRYEEIKRKDSIDSHRAGILIRVMRNTGIGFMIDAWQRRSNYLFEQLRERRFVGVYVTQDF